MLKEMRERYVIILISNISSLQSLFTCEIDSDPTKARPGEYSKLALVFILIPEDNSDNNNKNNNNNNNINKKNNNNNSIINYS